MFNRFVSAYQRISERSRLYGLQGALGIRAFEKLQQQGSTEEHPLIAIRPPGARKTLQMRLGSSDPWVAEQVFVSKEYAPLNKLRDVHTIIDCGANVGYTSAYFLDHHRKAKVLAIEAEAANLALCQRNLQAYGNRAEVLHAAVWDRAGTLELFCPVETRKQMEWAWRVRTAPSSTAGESSPVHQERERSVTQEIVSGSVSSVTIGDLITRIGGAVDILKVDIEGAEEQVFAGDTSWLDRVRALAIEIHWGECETIVWKAMEGRDFETSTCGEVTVFWNRHLQVH